MSRERYNARIPSELKQKLRHRADERNVGMNEVLTAALEEYFDEDSYRTVSLEYLARIDRKYSKVLQRLDLLVEFNALFARAWFRNHPAPEDPERRETLLRQGDARFEHFADRLRDILDADESFQTNFENPETNRRKPRESPD